MGKNDKPKLGQQSSTLGGRRMSPLAFKCMTCGCNSSFNIFRTAACNLANHMSITRANHVDGVARGRVNPLAINIVLGRKVCREYHGPDVSSGNDVRCKQPEL